MRRRADGSNLLGCSPPPPPNAPSSVFFQDNDRRSKWPVVARFFFESDLEAMKIAILATWPALSYDKGSAF